MKVKKYVAPTMPEAMNQIRKELGPEAVILNSREVSKGGFLGLFKKKGIEIIAALDPEPLRTKTNKSMNVNTQTLNGEASPMKNNNTEVLDEWKQLKKIITCPTLPNENNYPTEYQIVYQQLLEQEVGNDLAKQLVSKVIKQNDPESPSSLDMIKGRMVKEIKNRLRDFSFKEITYEKRIVQFVGPTGVGKTTTLAKIAAKSILKMHKKVAFITTDTYRIAAIEQLKTYARILDVPLEVTYTIEDFKRAIEIFRNYDLILVDTAGRNYREKHYVKELQNTIDVSMGMDTYLVLSLTAKSQDITEIYDQFSPIPIKEVIFTKIDETRQYGPLLNIPLDKQTGIAYVTNGQDVPDDIIHITPDVIANYIVGENNI
ncbi:flagellar biosynthesis protein FlhF [Virgibacillus natechei]|uniref:flagellar biosynthesis protein FlhF n=1 Tax=Virgibacillus sp. CBA3643 TaxID=2942278 RepID=UPI0035A2C266